MVHLEDYVGQLRDRGQRRLRARFESGFDRLAGKGLDGFPTDIIPKIAPVSSYEIGDSLPWQNGGTAILPLGR
jgi:hypothetical protein